MVSPAIFGRILVAKLTIELDENDIDDLIVKVTELRDQATDLWEQSRRLIAEMDDMTAEMRQIIEPFRVQDD